MYQNVNKCFFHDVNITPFPCEQGVCLKYGEVILELKSTSKTKEEATKSRAKLLTCFIFMFVYLTYFSTKRAVYELDAKYIVFAFKTID